ncbi:DMT family transporter [Actinomadura roseirufa]|uniref:DMT family transporter n=1 Tax=Actinomadura roseirufa TaxID=2094049 RepID=UPI001F5F8672|nr:DMT family transporter [Actinomadura roseirufa]
MPAGGGVVETERENVVSRRGWVLFALMSVLWGIPYLMIKVAVDGVSVPVLVFARTALGALLLLPLAIRAGGMAAAVLRHWRPLLLFAALEILGPWALLSDAEHRLTSSMTGLLIAAVPIIAVLLARLTGDAERLGPLRWAGLLVGLGGVGVLAGPYLGGGDTWALGEVLLVALGYAGAPLIATRRLQNLSSLHLATSSLALAALAYTGPAIATWPDERPSARVLWALAGLGVLCTALAFLVFFELIREVGTSRAMVFTYVNPAVAVVAGVLFLDEPLTATITVSFALILGGSVLATARHAPTAESDPIPANAMPSEALPTDSVPTDSVPVDVDGDPAPAAG